MATTTPNYNLVKPALSDSPPDITAMNGNWDTIDINLKNLADNKLDKTGDASNTTNVLAAAASRANLATGEKLSVSLGKLMKWFTDFKAIVFSGSTNDLTDPNAHSNLGSAANATQSVINSNIDSAIGIKGVPVGTVIDASASAIPAGYLFANGQAVSRTTYAALFGLIGTYYGVGDGSTTFNLPDWRGRGGMGYDGTAEFTSLGKTGGERFHALTGAEAPPHNHNNLFWADGTLVSLGGPDASGYALSYALGGVSYGNYTASIKTDSQGYGYAHNNLQPYITTMKCIKY